MIKTKYREIKVNIPLPSISLDILEAFEAQSSHRNLPVIWDKAIDFNVWDVYENKYIDFTSGIFVANIGHSNLKVIKAITKQLDKSLIYSYNFPSEIRASLLTRLIEITPDFCEKAFLLSTGAEAVECAVKLMRLYTGKRGIISFYGSMHGKTALAEALRGYKTYDEEIGHLDFPTKERNFNEDIIYTRPSDVAGFIIESYQGWSGRFYPKRYIQELINFAHNHNILVCFDEVQGGFGRTGKLFAYQHYEVEPDLLVLGKGLGGGVPISAVIGRKDILDIADDLTSTYGGNPLCCAGALANINYIMENGLIADSFMKGLTLIRMLGIIKRKFPEHITEINAIGLLGALIFKNENIATKVCYKAMQKGLLLVLTGRESVKIGPPLTIPIEALKEGLDVLEESIKEVINDICGKK